MYTDCMRRSHVGVREARARFADLLDDAGRGTITVVTRHGRAAAAIVPAALMEQLASTIDDPGTGAQRPDAGPALQTAAAGLRDALHALEPLLARAAAAPGQAAAIRVPDQGRPGRGALVAASLADLRGPAHGTVELPLRLFWSAPDRAFDLDKPVMLRSLYETVLREASRPEDLTSYLDGDTLISVWPQLYLPKGIRRAWEEHHPTLRAARLAAA